MARRKSRHAAHADAIDEIESWGDQASDWLSDNARVVFSCVAGVLILAAAYGFWSGSREDRESAAADVLALTRAEYMRDMGAAPGSIEIPELANPEAALAIREEYSGRLGALAEEHPGTVSGALARLLAGNLIMDGGDSEGALAIWRAALAEVPGGWPVAGLLHQRIGQALEEAGDWEAAAQAYEAAAAIEEFAFRDWAMVSAALCYALAEQPDKAVGLYERVEAEYPNLELPDHLRIRFRELQAAQSG